MDHLALGALADAEEYAFSLDAVALEHRIFGHPWQRHPPEEINNGILRIDFDCECEIGKTRLLYPDGTYSVQYDYSRAKNYLRRGSGGVLSSRQRRVIERIALGR